MLRPRDQPVQPGGGSDDEGNDVASSGMCYDAMSYFNVTVSLGHKKTPSPPAGSAASRQTGPRHTSTSRSVDTTSLESRSLDSGSTSVSRAPSLAESIGNFDPEKAEAEARKALAGSGLLSGDMSGAFPESIKRAEEVLQHTRETLARADGVARDSLAGGSDGGHDSLSTEELEGLSRALKRALFVCPNHKGLHAMRGEVHRRLQDFRTAVGCLRLAVRMDKSALNVRQRLAEVLLSQGMVWLDGGDSEAALACFEEACTVDGANASVHFCKTVALVKLGRFVEALRSVEAVLGRRKGTADDYVLRAKIRWAVGMVGPGNIDLGIAKTLQSDHPEVVMFGRRCLGNAEGLYAKAKELADAGDDVRAVKVLNQVADLTPEDVKVPIMRAACKRRLKDFVGALRDYDECSFRHFREVHVGRRALDQAASRLRSRASSRRGEGTGGPGVAVPGASGGGSGIEGARAGGDVVLAAASGQVVDGENTERVENSASDALAGGGDVGKVSGEKGEQDTPAGVGETKRGGGGGDGDSATVEPGRAGGSVSPFLPLSDRGTNPPRISTTEASRIEEDMEMQVDCERLADEELRRRFRLAIPHAGPDPSYTFRPLQPQRQQEKEQTPPQRLSREQQQQNVLLSSTLSGGIPSSGKGGLLKTVIVEGERGQQSHGEGKETEGYSEPPYITRQRCLVLNDWALSLFEVGEYEKAVYALDLAIDGDRASALATGGAMESKFFLNRGDCYRGSGDAEMAVRDYTRALEVEPSNWMVKTRLSMAHYLKGHSLFNDGNFLEAKSELDTAIAYNWKDIDISAVPFIERMKNSFDGMMYTSTQEPTFFKVSAYYLSRGHAQYFGGRISEAHADYRRALELDPGNVEAGRLCRQFDSKGKLTAPSAPSRKSSKKERQLSVAAPSSSTEGCKTSTVPLPLAVPLSSWSSSSSTSSTWSLLPPSRPSRGPQPPTPASPIPTSDRSLRTTTTASSSASDTSMTRGICCKQCGSKAGGCETSEPCTRQVAIPGRTDSGGALKDICRWKPKRHRRVRRRGQGNRLPKVDTRPPKEPEWGESAISWAKASDNGVKRVFKERFGGVPPRNERLWGMLRTSPTKSWSSTGARDGSSVASSRKAPPVVRVVGSSIAVALDGRCE